MCNLYITNGTKKKLKNKQNKKHPQFSIGWTNSPHRTPLVDLMLLCESKVMFRVYTLIRITHSSFNNRNKAFMWD